MTIKDLLYCIKRERLEIEQLNAKIDEMHTSLLPAGIRYDKDRVQSSPVDSMSEAVTSIVDYEEEVGKRLVVLYERKLYAERLIARLDDSRERQVIDLFFMSEKAQRMEDVAIHMNYSVQHCWRFYESAINHLEKMRDNESKSSDMI